MNSGELLRVAVSLGFPAVQRTPPGVCFQAERPENSDGCWPKAKPTVFRRSPATW